MTTLCIYGVKDGIGSSTVVQQLAWQLAETHDEPVLVIDAHPDHWGELAQHSSQAHLRSLGQSRRDLEKLHGSAVWSYYSTTRVPFGVCTLFADDGYQLSWEDDLQWCMQRWREVFPWIIIDAGARVDAKHHALWSHCTHWALCAQALESHVPIAERITQAWDAAFLPAQSSGVIGVQLEDGEAPLIDALAERVHRQVWARFPKVEREHWDDTVCMPSFAESTAALSTNAALHHSAQESKVARSEFTASAVVDGESKERILQQFFQETDLQALREASSTATSLRQAVRSALARIVNADNSLPPQCDRDALCALLADDIVGLGPLEELCADPELTEIMVNGAGQIFVERGGVIERSSAQFRDRAHVRQVIDRIVAPTGRRVDERSPIVDTRLLDGSRVNIVLPPIALNGPCITIRRFSDTPWTLERLCEAGALNPAMARWLRGQVAARKNMIIFGGTGSGKTTLLNALSSAIADRERIITIEDAAELQLQQRHVVRLEARPANIEGEGAIPIRGLVRTALRMRPDRIVVGECRGGEALDMLQAMNTGHDGSLTTVHANSAPELLHRLVTLVCFAGLDMPIALIQSQIASAIDVVVHVARQADGSRGVVGVHRFGTDEQGQVISQEITNFTGQEGA